MGRFYGALVVVGLLTGCAGGLKPPADDCAPVCDDRECGTDGCGGVCGSGEPCDNLSDECSPDCTDRECGEDGCGGVCGKCPSVAPICNESGLCELSCTPQCDDRECGDDGCGGVCGACPTAVPLCTDAGQCISDKVPVCGDGVVDHGEVCDDGNTISGDYCSFNCGSVTGTCGDAVVQTNEECDDANTSNTDTCLNTCQSASCGDTFIREGQEECEDGNEDSTDACVSCMNAVCGDGAVHADVEGCDDGDTLNNGEGGCLSDCSGVQTCGDTAIEGTEECDDGNDVPTDACLNSCVAATCGDAVVHSGAEACDDGDTLSNGDGACLSDCSGVQSCGDAQVEGTEECDDGDQVDNDICSNTCLTRNPVCGDGTLDEGEACDDGALNSDTAAGACRMSCVVSSCGDGAVDGGEACDDGNDVDTDECSNECSRICTCANGTKATGPACTAHNSPICAECDAGFHPVGDVCLANLCTCTGGTKAVGAACTKHNANICMSCDSGLQLAGASDGDTACDAVFCGANERVSSNACVGCASGTTNGSGDDASGSDTACDAVLCNSNEHVVGNKCVACSGSNVNAAGDDASGLDTSCGCTPTQVAHSNKWDNDSIKGNLGAVIGAVCDENFEGNCSVGTPGPADYDWYYFDGNPSGGTWNTLIAVRSQIRDCNGVWGPLSIVSSQSWALQSLSYSGPHFAGPSGTSGAEKVRYFRVDPSATNRGCLILEADPGGGVGVTTHDLNAHCTALGGIKEDLFGTYVDGSSVSVQTCGSDASFSGGTCTAIVPDPLCGVQVAAYYPHYGRYRMPIADIQYEHLTDIIFSSLVVAADGSLTPDHPATLQQLVETAHEHGVRVGGMVGGQFSEMVDNADGSRTRFLSELKAMALLYELDGIDFDWEESGGMSSVQRTHYAELVEEAAAKLSPLGMYLSIASTHFRNELPASALTHLSWMNCMSYDAGAPDHSSLQDGIDVLEHWTNLGASPGLLLMGTAFYGRKADWSATTWADLVASYAPAPEVDAVDGWGFPGINTTATKVKHVMDGGFRGIMIWELSQDTLDETSLLGTIGKTIRDHCPWQPVLCDADERVSGNTCVGCAPGTTNVAGDDVSGDDTACDAVLCNSNEHAVGNKCVACSGSNVNTAGDDASGSDTSCGCTPTQVANSNKTAANSVQGDLGDVAGAACDDNFEGNCSVGTPGPGEWDWYTFTGNPSGGSWDTLVAVRSQNRDCGGVWGPLGIVSSRSWAWHTLASSGPHFVAASGTADAERVRQFRVDPSNTNRGCIIDEAAPGSGVMVTTYDLSAHCADHGGIVEDLAGTYVDGSHAAVQTCGDDASFSGGACTKQWANSQVTEFSQEDIHNSSVWDITTVRNYTTENVFIDNGLLNMKVDVTKSPATRAEIRTKANHYLYGSYRAEIKVTNEPGTVIGWFYYRNDQSEIDIEILSHTPQKVWFTIHEDIGPDTQNTYIMLEDPVARFHEYRFDWYSDRVEYFFDGTHIRTLTSNIPTEPGMLMLNHWSGTQYWGNGPPAQNTTIQVRKITMYYD